MKNVSRGFDTNDKEKKGQYEQHGYGQRTPDSANGHLKVDGRFHYSLWIRGYKSCQRFSHGTVN